MSYISQYLKDLIPVSFELETAEEFQTIGTGPAEFKVTLKRPLPRTELLRSTSLALGEAYMRGDIELDRDLFEVLDLFLGQMGRFKSNKRALRSLIYTSKSKGNQKKEVTSHYDIGNDFYRLWLDETMSYSCGYFKRAGDSLFEAQVQKVDHILDKLQLEKGMTLLDIGCGWGFLLKRAAQHYGVKGVGITLSEEQYRQFSEEIRDQHMEDRLEVKLMDYRDLEKSGLSFDRVVSVGMLEHVGRGNYECFLQNVEAVLKPEGLFLLHYISAQEEHPGDPWIKIYLSRRDDSELEGDHRADAGILFLYAGCGESAETLYPDPALLEGEFSEAPGGDCAEIRGRIYADVGAVSGFLCCHISQWRDRSASDPCIQGRE